MKVLSYNIFYKTMIAVDNKPMHPKCWPVTDGTTACLKNVSDFIENHGTYDFIGLQEATNWETIQQTTPVLTKMIPVSHKLDRDEIVTFYHPKYQLDLLDNQIFGHMEDINRPFIILFFNSKLAVINLHAGHNNDIDMLDEHLKRTIKNNYNKKIVKKLQNYDIVLMGDFNKSINSNFTILIDPFFQIPNGRKMYGANREPSCCNYQLAPIKFKPKFSDQILSTLTNIQTKVYQVSNASDHMPITAIIQKNIGYDFDGVLHLEVTKADKDGQRYAVNDTGPYEPFKETIEQIQKNLQNGDRVYIVTSRTHDSSNERTVKKHLKKSDLPKIPIYFTDGGTKIDIIKKLKISEYYDDSCLQIRELYQARKNGELPHLTELYLAVPEKRKFIQVFKNFSKLCSPKNSQKNSQKNSLKNSLKNSQKWIKKLRLY